MDIFRIMKTYVVLLRAVNVSGKNLIKMSELKEAFQLNGFADVQTYIQSGNIVLKSKGDETFIQNKIRQILKEKFHLDVQIFVLTKEELIIALENNPLDKTFPGNMVYFTFLNQEVSTDKLNNLSKFAQEGEVLISKNKILYFYTSIGAGKSKISNTLIESKLNVVCTMRNRNTIEKLRSLI